MSAASRALGLALVLCCALSTAQAGPEPREAEILGVPSVPPDILKLLAETREAYGSDAVLLQLQLLHHAVHAGSILPAGVQVTGIEAHEAQRYLAYAVETGIVFNDRRTDRRQRVSHVWSDIVLPALGRLETYDVPADGIAVELSYFHRPYRDNAELEDTVQRDPGTGERTAFYLLRPDILAYRRHEIDASQLYSRSRPRVDGVPVALPWDAAP